MRHEIISSRNNSLVKDICGLSAKKNRAALSMYRFDGIKLFSEAVSSGVSIRYAVVRCHESPEVLRAVESALEAGALSDEKIIRVTEGVFEKISEEMSPEGIITVAECSHELHTTSSGADISEHIRPEDSLLLLESVRDPGNLGTILRSCYSLGIDRVILSSDCADIYNSKTLRAAMGSAFKINTVSVENMVSCIHELRRSGRCVYAAALSKNAISIDELKSRAGDCFLIGNEGHGLSEETVAASDGAVIIPMTEGAESLNASAAATICIWETVRRRRSLYEG